MEVVQIITESDPGVELLTPQTFCFGPIVVSGDDRVTNNDNVNSL